MAEVNANINLNLKNQKVLQAVQKIEDGVNDIERINRRILAVDKQIVAESRSLLGLDKQSAQAARNSLRLKRLERSELTLQKRELQGIVSLERRRKSSLTAGSSVSGSSDAGGGAGVAAAAAALARPVQSLERALRASVQYSAQISELMSRQAQLARYLVQAEDNREDINKKIIDQQNKIAEKQALINRAAGGEKVGRSVKQLQSDLTTLNTTLDRYNAEWDEATKEVKFHADAVNRLTAELNEAQAAQARLVNTRKSGGSFSRGAVAGLAFSNLPGEGIYQAGVAGALAGGAKGGVAGVLVAAGAAASKTAGDMARLTAQVNLARIALLGVTATSQEYNDTLAELDRVSQRFNVPLKDSTEQYIRLRAATIAAGFSAEETLSVYEALSAANTALGGDAQRLNGILLASTQIFSKGKVAAEELRGQIGERLAGAFSDFAKASGISTQKLDADLKKGEVSLDQFLKFAIYVGNKYSESADKIAKAGESSGARLTKAWEKFQLALGPILQQTGSLVQSWATSVVNALTPIAEQLARITQASRAGKNDRLYTVNQLLERNKKLITELEGRQGQTGVAERLAVLRRQTAALNAEAKVLREFLYPKTTGTQGTKPVPQADPKVVEAAAKNLDLANELTTQLARQAALGELNYEYDQRRLQAAFDYADKLKRISELEDQSQRSLQESLAARVYELDLAKLATEEARKQAEFAKQLTEEKLRGANYSTTEVARLSELTAAGLAVKNAAEATGEAFRNAFNGIVTGSQTAQQAVAGFFKAIGAALVDYAALAISKYIAIGVARIFAGVSAGKTSLNGSEANYNGSEFSGGTFGVDQSGLVGPSFPARANGGAVSPNQAYLVGESGAELFIPGVAGTVVSDPFDANRGALGSAGVNASSAFSENEAALSSTNSFLREKTLERERMSAMNSNPIEVVTSTKVINQVEYASVEDLRASNQAAVKEAQARMISSLTNRPSTRARIGL